MGFIYNKPLSLEQIFSMYNSKGGEKIDTEEVANAKNIKIFQGFQIQEGWTLEDFERENIETYKLYEELATRAWTEQQKNTHINYIRVHFGIKEGSADDIKDGESVEDFERRLCQKEGQKLYQEAKEKEQEAIKKIVQPFGLNNDS